MSDSDVPFKGGPVGRGDAKVTSAKPLTGQPGHYTRQIGSGENARNSFIYITISWSFIVGSVTTGAIYIRSFGPPEMTAPEILDMVKGVWSIFLPIITLSLGYAFGKGKK